MVTREQVRIGDWYQRPGNDSFEVVAMDEAAGTAEIQYFDGAIEEIDLESWDEQMFVAAAPPEDWSGSMDVQREDYGLDFDERGPGGWENSNPLDSLDSQFA